MAVMCHYMCMAAWDTFFDILSATLGAASGAIVTALANRQKNKSLNDQIVVSNQELEKIRLENDRLLKKIEEREIQILAQEKLLAQLGATPRRKKKNE